MRKLTALFAAVTIVAGFSSTALAAKPKKIHETFGASLAPFPKLAAWGDAAGLTKPGCTAGEEGVHWVAQDFTAPGKGTLRVYMEGFVGDHDLYIFKDDVPLIRSENSQAQDQAPAEEEAVYPMAKGETITMVACNWLGGPDVLAHYEGTFR